MESVHNLKRNWQRAVQKYVASNRWHSTWQIMTSIVPYVLSWWVAYKAYEISLILCFLVSIPAHIFLVRVFVILHDCGHGSFFKSKNWRNFWGFICGVMTFTPYQQWTRTHREHHKHAGNVNFRGIGDINLMTVEEYQQSSFWQKLLYKTVRSPFMFLLLGPIFVFIIQHRFTKKEDDYTEQWSVHFTNIAIITSGLFISHFTSFGFYIFYQFSVVILSAFVGILLFYVQHQYESVYWREDSEWNHYDAALQGSSYLKLPKILQWATGNIGFHHIHHLCSAIPNYNLEKAYKENDFLQQCAEVRLFDIPRCLFLALYDMNQKRLISFNEYRRLYKLSTNE